MASARESICQNDPNFAVICSFLNRYGDILGIPKISFAELQTYLEETKYVSDVLIDLHVRLLRKLGKTSANYEKWERCVMKFCFGYSSVDGWEMEQLGYSKLALNTRLRILKNLLEAQFDNNNRFKDKINEKDSAELRFLPIGRDRNGLAYWYLLDDDFNLRVYREEQDDENAETWTLVCSNRNDLAALIAELENPTDLRPEKDKLSTTSGDSDSKDEESVLKGKVKCEEEVKVKSKDEVKVKGESEAAPNPEVKVEPEEELKLKSEDKVVKSETDVTAVTKVKVEPDKDKPETENVTEAGKSSHIDKEGGSLKSSSEVGKDNLDKVDSNQSDKTSETASETQQKSFDNETIVEKDKQRSSSLSTDNTKTEMKDKNRPEGKKSGKATENSDNSKDSTLCSADDKEVKEISIGKKDDKSEDVENKDASKLTISKGEKSDNDSVANDSERDIEATSVSVKSSESNAVSVICKVSTSEKGNSKFKDCAKPDQKGKVCDPKDGSEVCESTSNVDNATRTEQSVEKDRISVTENRKSEDTLSSKNNTDISVKKTDKKGAKCERVADPKNSDKVSDSVCVGKGNSNISSETVDQKPGFTIEKQGSVDAVKTSQDTPDDTSKPVTEVDPSKTSCSDVNYVRQSPKPEKELSCDKTQLEKDGGKAVSESNKKGKVETEAIPADSLAQKTIEDRSGKNRIKPTEKVTESASEEAKQPHQETGASRAHVNQEKDDTVEGNNTKNKQKDLESPLKKAEILQESVKCVIKSSSKENVSDSEKDNRVQSVEKQQPEASTQSSVEAQIKVKTEKDLDSDTEIQDKTSKSSETKSKVLDIDCQGDKTTTESPKTKTEDSENTGKSSKPSKVDSGTIKTEPDKVSKDCSDSKIQISEVSKNETVETKDTSKTADSSLKVGIESETSKSTSTSKTDNKCSSKDTSTSSPSSPLPENLPSIEVEKEKDSDKLQGDEAAECSANKECLQDTSVKSDGANAKESENCSKTVQDPDRLKSSKKVATKRKPTRSSSVSNLQKLAKNSDASDSENDKTAAECDKIASQDPAVDNTIKDTAGIPTSKEESEKGEKSEKPSEVKINEDVEKTDGVSNTEPEKGSRKQKLTVKEDVADSPAPEVEVSERTGRPLRATRSRSARGRGGFTTTSGNQKPAQTTAAARSNQRASKRQVPVETSEPSSPESEEEPVVKQARRGRVRGKGRGGNQSNQRRTQAKKPPVEESDESDDDIPLSKISTPSKSRAKRGKNQASRGGRSKTRPKADENSTPVRKSSRPRKRKKVESDEEFCVKQTRGGRSAAGGGSARKGGGNGGRSGTRRGRRIVATSDEDTDQEQEEEEERLVFEALEGGESSDALSFRSDSDSPKEESDEDYEPQKKGRNARRAAARSGEHELVSQHEGEKVESQSEIEDDTPCCKCQKSNHPEWILLCDKCDAGYHTACLRPPLMIIPEGDWFCPPCQHKSLVEKLCENLKDLDSQLKKFERLLKRKERLAYVGISLDNIVKEERKENVAPEYFDEFDDYEIKSKKKHRHSSRDRHRKRDKHRRRHDRWERESSEEIEQVFTQRTCRARASVSYQFKEYDDLINSAIQDDVKEPPPPGISRGKDMYNIEEAESKPSPVSKSKRRKKRRLTMLDDDDDGDEDEDSEEYKATDESEATPVEEEVEEDSSTEDEFKWRSIRTRRFGKPSRRSSRKGGRWTRYDADFVVDDEYDSDGSDNCRRSSRSATKRRVCYREINSEGEASEATPSTTDDSSDDSSDKKRRKRPKIQKQSKKPAKRKGVLFSDDSEEEQSKASESSAESHSASSDEDSDSNKKSEKRKKKPVLEESEEASDNSKSNSSGSDSDKSGRVKHSKRASARKVKYNRISDSETEEDQPESAETPVKSSTKAKTELNEDSGSEDSKPDKKSDSPKDDEGKDDEESDVVVPGKPRGMKFTSGNNPAVRKVSQIEPVIDQSTQDSDISESPKVSNASSNGNSVDEPGPVLELQPPNGHGFDRYTPQMPSAVYPQGYGYEGSQHPYYSNNQTDTYQPQGYFPTPQGNAPYCSPSQHSRSPHHGMPHPEHGPHYTSLPGHDIRPPTMGPNVPHREMMSCPPPNPRDQRSHHPPQSTATYQELQPSKVDRRAGMGPACPKPGGPQNPSQPRPPQPRGSFMMDSILRTKGYGEGDEDDLSDVSDLISYVTQDS